MKINRISHQEWASRSISALSVGHCFKATSSERSSRIWQLSLLVFALLAMGLPSAIGRDPIKHAVAEEKTDFEVNWSSVDGGGATAAGGEFVIGSTVGQPDLEISTDGHDQDLIGGFWSVAPLFVDPIFEDGFETGDLSNWSNTGS